MEDSPEWLNDIFLKHILHSAEETAREVAVLKWSCQPAVAPGSNYLSLLYRVNVHYKMDDKTGIQSKAFIIKTPLKPGMLKDFVLSVNGYSKELLMYNKVLPKMYELLACRVTARSFDCPLENSLVLEDLRGEGYKMADRLKQLDFEHCQEFLISLSKLHALFVAVHHKEPELIEEAGKLPFLTQDTPDSEREKKFIEHNFRAMLATIKNLPECECYAEMIESKLENIYDTMVNISASKVGLTVLNHGDTWTNNILFKYDESGKPTNVKLVDFQMCKYGSFGYDLVYFWWTSTNEDVRENHKEELFEVYRQTLNQTLEELACGERVSKEELDSVLKIWAPYSISIISGILPVVLADPDNLVKYENLTEEMFDSPPNEDSPQANNYKSIYYTTKLPKLLQHAEAFGVFR